MDEPFKYIIAGSGLCFKEGFSVYSVNVGETVGYVEIQAQERFLCFDGKGERLAWVSNHDSAVALVIGSTELPFVVKDSTFD